MKEFFKETISDLLSFLQAFDYGKTNNPPEK